MTTLLTNNREATDGQTWVDGKTEKKKRTKQLCLDLLTSAGPVSVCVRERLMNVKIKREECVRRRGEMRWFHAAWADVCHNLSDWTRGVRERHPVSLAPTESCSSSSRTQNTHESSVHT